MKPGDGAVDEEWVTFRLSKSNSPCEDSLFQVAALILMLGRCYIARPDILFRVKMFLISGIHKGRTYYCVFEDVEDFSPLHTSIAGFFRYQFYVSLQSHEV